MVELQRHSKFANTKQNWTVVYYNERVKRDVFALPAGILADYLRLLDLMQEFGADLRMPHSRAMGADCLNCAQKAGKASGACFTCTHVGQRVVVLHSFVKKTQETPQNELRTARVRLSEVRNG
ncbi:type II toxin-antitoxin system RelE/ParE family toxin [Burkholderia pseudomallei]|uniref:type II toxin-antitoxin system RelE/ParE family toxin n=2 Tax=Burkholderia pseudomallei TaxID=28450 RepID=UPI0015615707